MRVWGEKLTKYIGLKSNNTWSWHVATEKKLFADVFTCVLGEFFIFFDYRLPTVHLSCSSSIFFLPTHLPQASKGAKSIFVILLMIM